MKLIHGERTGDFRHGCDNLRWQASDVVVWAAEGRAAERPTAVVHVEVMSNVAVAVVVAAAAFSAKQIGLISF